MKSTASNIEDEVWKINEREKYLIYGECAYNILNRRLEVSYVFYFEFQIIKEKLLNLHMRIFGIYIHFNLSLETFENEMQYSTIAIS